MRRSRLGERICRHDVGTFRRWYKKLASKMRRQRTREAIREQRTELLAPKNSYYGYST